MSLAVVTFGVVFAAIVGAYWLLVQRPEQQEVDVVRGRIKGKRSTKRSAVTGQLELQARETGFSSFDALLKRASAKTAPLQLLIEQSGVKIGLGRLFLVSAVLAALVFVGVLWFAPDAELSLVVVPLALVAAAFAAFVPFAVLKMQRGKRLRKFEEQFPEALDLLARALRAGHAFTSCLEMVADDMAAPAGPEFRLLFDKQNYGMPLSDALREFATRVMLLDARFFATAVLIQRESGGNLSEVLDKLAGVIRTRFKVKRQMRVVSAHGRITGWILAGLPPVVFLVMTAMNPDYRATMFGTKLGVQMLWGAVGLQVIGTLVIRKIINPEY